MQAKWDLLDIPENSLPSERYCSLMASIDNNRILILGGFVKLSTMKGQHGFSGTTAKDRDPIYYGPYQAHSDAYLLEVDHHTNGLNETIHRVDL